MAVSCAPRVSGDEPSVPKESGRENMCSPHERGSVYPLGRLICVCEHHLRR